MASKDPRIDAYIAQAEPFARPILKHLRKVVRAGCGEVAETRLAEGRSHNWKYERC